MSYMSLYRKFRPTIFDEMVGQEHITKTVKNQIKSGRIGHAYLFCGGRGTGKTSSAKILARAINCENPKDGEPCNTCEICTGILNGSLTDVLEMDAASNNGVENIRQIREEVNFLPTRAKYRVYIVDEVHMLSTGAFNALLKTLEEPPEHVIFILATTEPGKLPATILSRCQRFDFKKIDNENIIKRLKIICNEIQINVTDAALKLIAVLSEGAMRDAISILERCISIEDTEVTDELIKELVGIPKLIYISKLTKNILEENSIEALSTLDEIIKDGKDYSVLIWELVKYFKDILVYKSSKNLEIYNEEELKEIEDLGKKVSNEKLLKLIYAFSELENNMKWSSSQLVMLQAGIIRACSKTENNGLEEVIKRLEVLENNASKRNSNPVEVSIAQTPIPERVQENIVKKEEVSDKIERAPDLSNIDTKPAPAIKTVDTTESGDCLPYWSEVINNIKQKGKLMLYTNLIGTKAKEINDMTIGIELNSKGTSFTKTVIEQHDNIQIIKQELLQFCGKEMNVKCIEGTTGSAKKESKKVVDSTKIEDMAKSLDLPINIID